MSDLEDKCFWLDISLKQREVEQEEYQDNLGILGFENVGCYDCNGLNKDCEEHYIHDN